MIVRRTNTNVFWKYVLLHIVRIVIAVIVLSLLVRVFILRGNLSHEGALADLLDAAGNGCHIYILLKNYFKAQKHHYNSITHLRCEIRFG